MGDLRGRCGSSARSPRRRRSRLNIGMRSEGRRLGAPCLSFSPEADPPAVNAEVRSAFSQVAELDDRTFMRHLTQITQGFYGEELADRMLEQIPAGVAQAYVRHQHGRPGRLDRGCPAGSREALAPGRARSMPAFHEGGIRGRRFGLPDSMRVSCQRSRP